jgi:SAM-dependent methyltransferase
LRAPDHSSRYVDDVDYVRSFIAQLAPAWLDFVALLWGFAPPDRDGGYAWCDLGCGQGVNAVVLAATQPHGDFHGVDMMPSHIAHGRGLAAAVGARNAAFHEADFAEAARRGLPAFDYITAHGVYSWVDDKARTDLRSFVDAHLKPGGRVYLSYNALPGRGADLAFQRLILEIGRRVEGDSITRVKAAQALVTRLARRGAPPILASPMADLLRRPGAHRGERYLAHELMNPHWRPLSVLEARADMASIGLEPAGSATIADNFDDYVLGRGAQRIVNDVDDPELQALVRDYLTNQGFRRDVFVRSGTRLTERERRRRVLAAPFALNRPKSSVRYRFATSAGQLAFDNPMARRIVAGLASGPRSLADLAASTAEHDDLIANGMVLAASGQIIPVEARVGDAGPFNRVVLERLGGPEELLILALGCGTAVGVSRERLAAIKQGGKGQSALRAYLAAYGAGLDAAR